MNKMLSRDSFFNEGPTPYGSGFEKPEAELLGTPAVCVQFGSRLRRMFELPCGDSQPDQFQALLQQLEAKLERKG
jgi:hypothetical protein